MLSEESILDLWSPGRPTLGKNKVIAFARAIEREAYKAGQEAMRERSTLVCDKQHDAARTSPGAARAMFCSDAIRNLEIEEPTK